MLFLFSFFATLVTTLGRAAVHVWPNPNSISFLKKGRFDASRFRSPRTDVNRGLICDNFLTGPLVQICPLTTFHYQVVATKVDQCVGHPPAVASFHPFVFCFFFFGVKVCTRLGGSLTGFIICARMGVNRCQTEICIFVSSIRPCCPLTRVCIGTAT